MLERALDGGVQGVDPRQGEGLGGGEAGSLAPRARPAASGPWWLRTQWSSARRRGGSSDGGRGLDQLRADREVAEHRPLLADPELGPVGELARLADVVQERRGHQQVGVELRVELADLADQRADGDGVLEQPAEVGVMAGPGAGGAAELGGDRLGVEDPLDDRPQRPGRRPRASGARGSR